MIAGHDTCLITAGRGRARAAGLWQTKPGPHCTPELFPLTEQLSIRLLRTTNRGTLTAGAEVVHRGGAAIVVDVGVSAEAGPLSARLAATQLTAGSATPAAR